MAGRILWAATTAGVAVTAVVVLVPDARFAYDNPSLHIALETTEGLIAALLAVLAFGRLRTTGAVRDLALAAAFTTLAVANLVVSAAPAVAFQERPGGFVTWLAVLLRLVGAASYLSAAVAPPATVTVDARLARRAGAATAAVLVATLMAASAADLWLAEGLDSGLSPAMSQRPTFSGHPLLLTAQALGALFFGSAAVQLNRRATATGDELLDWLAGGAALSAASRLNYCLFPSLYSQWVYVGDVLRLGAYLLFLVGAGREIVSYWRDRQDLAVDAERRRIARELHDGLTQELAFLRSQTAAMANGMVVPGMAAHLHAAAERALQESRRAIDVLADPARGGLGDALRHAAEEVAERAGATVIVHGAAVGVISDATHQALVRITREATTNAVRHGEARAIIVGVAVGDGTLWVTVSDDGHGFDPDHADHGFGLRSMRERAEALGGELAVRSAPGGGTTVEVRVPADR